MTFAFDSLDEMFAAMAAAEEAANARTRPVQRALLDPDQDFKAVGVFDGELIFHDLWSTERYRAVAVRDADLASDAPEIRAEAESELEFSMRSFAERCERGYRFSSSASAFTHGRPELGDVHVSTCWPISEDLYEIAASAGFSTKPLVDALIRMGPETTMRFTDELERALIFAPHHRA